MVLFPLKFYDKRDDFDFDIVNFPFLDGDVLRCTSYISQLIRFTRASSNVNNFTVVIKPLPPSSLGRAIVLSLCAVWSGYGRVLRVPGIIISSVFG